LDAILVVGIALVVAALAHRRRSGSRAETLHQVAALVVPFVLIVGVWLAWKIVYYGTALPNTFYAKTGGTGVWLRGADYLWAFAASYLLLPFLLLIPFAGVRLWPRAPLALSLLRSAVMAHAAYVASVGGDFMEFR